MERKEVVEIFPVPLEEFQIRKEHFSVFRKTFSRLVLERLPTAAAVSFLMTEDEAVAAFHASGSVGSLVRWQELLDGKKFSSIERGELLFSLELKDGAFVIVYVEGLDEVVLKRLDEEWLRGVCAQLFRDFSLQCIAYLDRETGVATLSHLDVLLSDWGPAKGGYLALVELPGQNFSFTRGYRYLRYCSRALKNFVRDPACLHYLGQRTFAMIFPCSTEKEGEEFLDFENSLIAYLKKEGCYRVHIGSSLWIPDSGFLGKSLLDRAWTALRRAEKRGPFSFCNYEHWAYPERHKLASVPQALHTRLRRAWSSLSAFSLLLLRADVPDSFPPLVMERLQLEQYFFPDGEDVYLLFPDDDGQQAEKYARAYIDMCKKENLDAFSGGIARFPFADFKKTEMPMNCKKALIHALFFGPGSVTTFDQTSLNISGDVYFAEGDFTKAIFEYRRGLACGSGEVNLYNSLGVTLALMNRLKPALDSFTRALELEPDNFMALYNSGLAQKDLGEGEKAFALLEQAYMQALAVEKEENVLWDLQLSLGILGVQSGAAEAAVRYLTSWFEHCGQRKESGKVYRYLGLAYYGMGEFYMSSEFLQKALNYDQFDAQSIALLGHIYLKTGEGEEIACTLCRKGVELEPENLQYQLYLAEALVACGEYDDAKKYIQRCRRSEKFRHDALVLMGELSLLIGRRADAKKYFDIAAEQQILPADMRQRIQQGLERCQESTQ